jgi:hypothetical protein
MLLSICSTTVFYLYSPRHIVARIGAISASSGNKESWQVALFRHFGVTTVDAMAVDRSQQGIPSEMPSWSIVNVTAPTTAQHIQEFGCGWPTISLYVRMECSAISGRNQVYVTPMASGIFINSFVFAGAAFLVWQTLGLVNWRRRLRTRRGLCSSCGYPIGVSKVCTECGHLIGLSE